MKIRIFLILVTLIPCVATHAQKLYPQPTLDEHNLKGPVKEVVEYLSFDENAPDEEEPFRVMRFTPEGYITEETYPGSSSQLYTYRPDSKNPLKIEYYNGDGSLRTIYTFDYDSIGRPSTARKVRPDGTEIFNEVNAYDVYPDSVVQHNHHFNHSDQSVIYARITYYPDNHKLRSMEYNINGVVTMLAHNDHDGHPVTMYKIGRGHFIMKHESDTDTIYRINPADGSRTIHQVSVRDSRGNDIEIVSGDERTTATYTYDTHGNWTRRTVHRNDGTIRTYTRHITYY